MSEERRLNRIDIGIKKRGLQHDIKQVVNGFKIVNKDCISNKEIRNMLVSIALGFEMEDPRLEECVVGSKEWDEAYKKQKERQEPVEKHLGELYNVLCHQVKDFLIEHPDMIKKLLEFKKEQSSRLNSRRIEPMVTFHFGIDDIFELLKYSMTSDVSCSFSVGNEIVSIC